MPLALSLGSKGGILCGREYPLCYTPRVARPLFFLRLLPRRHRGYQTVDGRAQLVEFRLVVGHHADGAVRVQIVCDLGERKAELRDLLTDQAKSGALSVLKWICPPSLSTLR